MSAHKRWPAKRLLLCGSILCALRLAEVGLRIIGSANPYFYTFEEQTGWALRPNVAGWFRKEGAAYVRINSQGLRAREHAKQKPADTYRIAIIGDSFCEAMQVVLIFMPANDIRNNSRALEGDELRPYFIYQGGELVADMSFRAAPAHKQKLTRFNNALYDAINHVRLLHDLRRSRTAFDQSDQVAQLVGFDRRPVLRANLNVYADDAPASALSSKS